LAAIIRVIQTRPASANATLRFIYEIDAAMVVDASTAEAMDREPPKQADENQQPEENQRAAKEIKIKGDRISLMLVGHEVVDVLVIFRNP
jgi:hypothetical protein